ncbi:macro domain-containing protein [Nanoarchaeota archaeon]
MTQIISKIKIINGDITKENVDIIVNSTNCGMRCGVGKDGMDHAAGVDKAINIAAGPELFNACKNIGHCDTGDVKVTPGFNLDCKYIFHAVGPVWADGKSGEEEKLKSCYIKCFKLLKEKGLRTIAFPPIATGLYGYPRHLAANIAFAIALEALKENTEIEEVRFVCADKYSYVFYRRIKRESQGHGSSIF